MSANVHVQDSNEPGGSSEGNQTVSKYLVQYENNGSKRWDGKVLYIDGEWLESLYQPNELSAGSKVKLPWSGKGGKISYWNGVILDPNSTAKEQGKGKKASSSTTKKAKAIEEKNVTEETSSKRKRRKKEDKPKGAILQLSGESSAPVTQQTININQSDIKKIIEQQGEMIHLLSRFVAQFLQQQQPVTPVTATPTVQQPITSVVQQPHGSQSITSYDGLTDELTDDDLEFLLSETDISTSTLLSSVSPSVIPLQQFSSSTAPPPTSLVSQPVLQSPVPVFQSPVPVLQSPVPVLPPTSLVLPPVLPSAVPAPPPTSLALPPIQSIVPTPPPTSLALPPVLQSTVPVPSTTSPLLPPVLQSSVPPPHFSTPPKLRSVQDVMNDCPGTDIQRLRELAIGLAKDAIFGKEQLIKCSVSGRKHTGTLDQEKLEYIKMAVHSRVPNKSAVEFEHIWQLCRSSISKSCQTLRMNARKKL